MTDFLEHLNARNALTCAALLNLSAGCGVSQDTPRNSESKLNVVGGRPVDQSIGDARRISTVALTTDHSRRQRSGQLDLLNQGRSFCSATIIAPRVLMTAAHCLQEFDPQTNLKASSLVLPKADDFIAYFGLRVSKAGEWMRAREVIPHPDWSPEQTLQGNVTQAPHDIGLVILEDNVPSPYVSVQVADESFTLSVNQPVTVVGYGVTRNRLSNNTGTLRQVQVPLKSVDTQNQLLGVGAFMKGACAGDSGGPLYAQDKNGDWRVIGVTSTGIEIFQNCVGIENSFTDARTYKRWIRETLAKQDIKF